MGCAGWLAGRATGSGPGACLCSAGVKSAASHWGLQSWGRSASLRLTTALVFGNLDKQPLSYLRELGCSHKAGTLLCHCLALRPVLLTFPGPLDIGGL